MRVSIDWEAARRSIDGRDKRRGYRVRKPPPTSRGCFQGLEKNRLIQIIIIVKDYRPRLTIQERSVEDKVNRYVTELMRSFYITNGIVPVATSLNRERYSLLLRVAAAAAVRRASINHQLLIGVSHSSISFVSPALGICMGPLEFCQGEFEWPILPNRLTPIPPSSMLSNR